MSNAEKTIDNLKHISRKLMKSYGMPSLVINAPEDSEDMWRIYPSGRAAIGIGRTLEDAIEDAMNYFQTRESKK